MKKVITALCVILPVLTAAAAVLYRVWNITALLAAAVTLGTVSYHFLMRLSVGELFRLFVKKPADPRKPWYRPRKWEPRLYAFLRVKQWKDRMPTWYAGNFDPSLHSLSEIASAMCAAELVHEVIILLSFLPVLAGLLFGKYPVFILTSFFAALVDLPFVMIQRFNRPRVLKIMERGERRSSAP